MSAQTIILVFTLVIYLIILFVFNKARKKYAGGKVGEVINLILFTVAMLFIADYADFLKPFLNADIVEILKALLRTAGLSFLAYGGSKIADS